MTRADIIVLDRAVRRRVTPPAGESVMAVAIELRRRCGWWAGMVDGGSPEGLAVRLRRRDVCVVVSDALARGVVWIDDVVQIGVRGHPEAAETIVPGCGPLWARSRGSGSMSRAWRALRRAHARAWLADVSGLPPSLWRRLSSDDPSAVQRAVRVWLQGDEALAVHLVHSALAARVARGEAGYRVAGLPTPGESGPPISLEGSGPG